jgi:alkylresorcinol/alkylpyrone synthase
MYVTGLSTANPPAKYGKAECWNAFRASDWFNRLDRRSHMIAETVLSRDNGIATRTLALDSLDEVFAIDPDTLHRRFATHAPALAAAAGRSALSDAGIDSQDIDAVVVSTCTGYLCPGLTSHVIERLDLRPDVQAFDLVGQGCAAALPNWRLAAALLGDTATAHVLSICVEVSSAAMYLDDDPGVLISACLFGDGAGAAVLSRAPNPDRRRIAWKSFASRTNPALRDALKFETKAGMLRNVLTRPVPQHAATHASEVLDGALHRNRLSRDDIAVWVMHAGGRDVLAALQDEVGLTETELRYSAAMLRDYGNMSSAFVYYVLKAALDDGAPGGWWWMSAFGAGFACHGALLDVG